MLMKVLSFVAISLGITLAIALGLIASQRPGNMSGVSADEGLDFQRQLDRKRLDAPEPVQMEMADGQVLDVRQYGTQEAGKPLLVMVHGSGWNGLQFNSLAQELAEDAFVLVPDLRGHGATPKRRGDVDYIGQMEDDLVSMINHVALDGQEIVVLGHSSGGGLAVRFAGGDGGRIASKFILLAPFLKYNAPTTRPNSGGWAHVLTRRMIGLSMLNAIGIKALNGLTVIQFAMPQVVLDGPMGHLATPAYSYRLNTGFAPRSDYLKDVAAMPEFVLIAGSDDEAFYAGTYQEVMEPVNAKGQYHIIEGETHLSIVDAPETASLIKAALR